jgi:hypothetical protein
LARFQADLEAFFLRPVKSKLRWSDKDVEDDGGVDDDK